MMLTASEAAGIIGCTPQQVRTLIRNKKLRAKKVASRNNQHGFEYRIDSRDAQRLRDAPVSGGGFPRGHKRNIKLKKAESNGRGRRNQP